jgi:hypothetical protein
MADSKEIAELRGLIAGSDMVIVGPKDRREQRRDVESAFDVKPYYVEGRQRGQRFVRKCQDLIARSKTLLVAQAIRLSPHFNKELRDICRRYGKVLVRLPAGFSSCQIAYQALAQCGDQLRASAWNARPDNPKTKPQSGSDGRSASRNAVPGFSERHDPRRRPRRR